MPLLKLSKLSDYAMLVIRCLSDVSGASLSVSRLAEQTSLGRSTISKLLRLLGQAGLVTALRGAQGGYRLAMTLDQITVADVVAAIDGPPLLTACATEQASCPLTKTCDMHQHWPHVNALFHEFLATIRMSDLVQGTFHHHRSAHYDEAK